MEYSERNVNELKIGRLMWGKVFCNLVCLFIFILIVKVSDSKEERTQIHKAIRTIYPGLESTTEEDGLQKLIKVTLKCAGMTVPSFNCMYRSVNSVFI